MLKRLIKLLLFLLAAILAGLLVARPAIAEAPISYTSGIYDYISSDITIKNNAIVSREVHKNPNPVQSSKQFLQSNTGGYSGRHYSQEEVIQLIKDYSRRYNINPEVPLCIAKLESGYNQFSKNASSTASGVYQYLESTWKGTDEYKSGLSVFDADANVRAAIKYMASRKNTIPWVVHTRCPSL